MKLFVFVAALALLPLAARAQTPSFTLACTDTGPPNKLQQRHCELRTLALPAPAAGTPLTVDARSNGSITVRAWPGPDVRVRARVVGRSATVADARALAAGVKISSQNATVRATSAAADGWEVSYEVLVPVRTDLALKAVNGALTIENVQGTVRFETTNGAVRLAGVAGDVRGRTTNGPLAVVLTAPAWTGTGLDASTVNGSVTWQLPAIFTGTLQARTSRGSVSAQLAPAARKLLQAHSLTATLGKGGPQLRVSTVNGSIEVTQEGAEPKPAEPAAEE